MGLQDKQISYIRKRIWLTPYDLQGLVEVTDTLGGSISTAMVPKEIGSAGISGLDIDNAEIVAGGILLPYDLDPKHSIGFRVHYSAVVGGTDAVFTWTLLWKVIAVGAAYAIPTAGLDTIIAADAWGADVDTLNKVTARGILLAATHQITREQIEDGGKLLLKNTLGEAGTITTSDYIGLEMDYVPQQTVGVGMETDAPLLTTGNDSRP